MLIKIACSLLSQFSVFCKISCSLIALRDRFGLLLFDGQTNRRPTVFRVSSRAFIRP